MDDRIRVSDADRDRVAARLREHFAEGRLSRAEFDERVTATLTAKTAGELRAVLADLPGAAGEPLGWVAAPVAPGPGLAMGWARPGLGMGWPRPGSLPHRGRPARPRLLPVVLIAAVAAVALPGAGWLLFAVLQLALLLWLVTCLAGALVAGRLARRLSRGSLPGPGPHRIGAAR